MRLSGPTPIHAVSSLFRAGRFTVTLLLLALSSAPSAPILKATGPGNPSQIPERFSASKFAVHLVVRYEADEAFLEDLSKRSFHFFWENADPTAGLVRARARSDGSPH